MTVNIHSIETLGALDGPGLRTIMFFKGCPLRCKYCHNADMLSSSGGHTYSIEYLVEGAQRYKNFYGKDGGVTLSGGEPLMQPKAVITLTKALHTVDIHVTLDTSGYPYNEEVLSLVDLVILDIKHTEKADYQELTGIKIDDSLKTLAYLKAHNKPFWIRQVIVEGITDTESQIKRLKELSAGAQKIELLPYHKMGVDKWKSAGLPYALDGVPATSAKTMQKVNTWLAQY